MKSTTWIRGATVTLLALVIILVVVATGHAIPMLSHSSTARASSLPQETNTFTGTATVPENVLFTPTGSLNDARWGHTATLLQDGKVLIAGGISGDGYLATELYDPVAGTFTLTGSLQQALSRHTATLLANGKQGTHCLWGDSRTVRSLYWHIHGHGQPRGSSCPSHGNIAAGGQGADCGWLWL